MVYALPVQAFFDNKMGFFEGAAARVRDGRDLLAFADEYAQLSKYPFVARSHILLQQEFEQLFASLKAKKKNRRDLWLYCYYCALMLETYHTHYGQKAKAQEYRAIADKIKASYKGERPPKREKSEDAFFTRVGKAISQDLVEMAKTPTQVSKLRDKVGFYNIVRIYWVFCRLTFTNSLRLLRDVKILELLENAIGKNIDVDAVVETLEAPNSIFRAFSVGFFLARLILNGLVAAKHMAGSSKEERTLPFKERFVLEMYKRHPVFLNDVVWAVVNGVTNYAQVFHISAAAAGWITAGFMVFDFALILWRRHLAEQEYLAKKAQYTAELAHCEHHRDMERYALVVEQLKNLEIHWQAKNSTFLFNATAALMLGAGFSASMLFTSPVLIVLSYAVCMVAVAMYLSDGAYNNYKEKSLRLQQMQVEQQLEQAHEKNIVGEDLARVLKEYQAARNEFIFTMIKNTVMPTLILATFAVCWQAALVLIAVYAAYELWNAYCKKKGTPQEPDVFEMVPARNENSVVLIERDENPEVDDPYCDNDLKGFYAI